MGTLWQDIRYGVRMLAKNPAFTAVAIIALALGIGANTAIFSVVNVVLLRPLPYENPEQLVRVGGANLRRGVALGTFSPQDFFDWRERNTVFAGLAAYDSIAPSLTGGGEPERIAALRVSPDFFHILGVNPSHGRFFLAQEEQRGSHQVAVLSHGLWQRRFGGDPNIIGQSVTLSGQSFTVIGIAPSAFTLPRLDNGESEQPELWIPFAPDLTQWSRSGRAVDGAIARLKPGVTVAQARAEMEAIARQLEQQYPESNAGAGVGVASLHEHLVREIRPALLVFLVAVGFVLLIACANVANLLLARATVRRKEIAVRAALGAGRGRIIRQLLTESILLAALGGLCGFLLALWATDFLVVLGSGAIPQLGAVRADAGALLFALLISLVTGIIFGLVPALQASKPDLIETLKASSKGTMGGAGRQRARNLLVISEVALSLLLLVGAGLLLKSFLKLQEVNPGFEPQNVLTMTVFLPGAKYREDQQQVAFFEQVLERTRSLPGVESAGITSNLPISGNFDRVSFYAEGHPTPAREDVPESERYMVDGDYFRALGLRLLAGRTFGAEDRTDSPPVAIINESLARRFWPEQNPIGQRIRTNPEQPWRTVVGVVGDVRHYRLETAANMQLYLPHRQSATQQMTLVVRSGVNPQSLAASVREQVWAVDREQPVYDIKSMEEWLAASVAERRFTMLLLGIFAAIALALAVVGIYSVMSYAVTQRTHEIGVRMALGAQGRDVLRLVVGQGMALALIGVALGCAASLALTRVMSGLLYGVSATDPATFALTSLTLVSVALLACYIPARRATRVDPMVALRYE